MDENGDFVVVGMVLEPHPTLGVAPVPGRAAVVAKDTVPPLDAQGREDFTNPFGAPYTIRRELDLEQGSPDLDLVLHTSSYGPPAGDFRGGPRIPRAGESPYNLNSFPLSGSTCPDLFPAASQRTTYQRPSYPLHEAPIWGMQGDGLAVNVDSGAQFVPTNRNGADCIPNGCSGEDSVHMRKQKPITLGEWLRADISVSIELADYDRARDAFTAATFRVRGRRLLPNAMYAVVVGRAAYLTPSPFQRLPMVPVVPSVLVTDHHGAGQLDFKLQHPFPSPDRDPAGLRVQGIGVTYRSDFSVHGACAIRLGPGVDVHAVASSFAGGDFEMSDFVTEPPRSPREDHAARNGAALE